MDKENHQDNLIGQSFSGTVSGVLDSGYLITARVGNNGQLFRGMVFHPEATRISAENDIAPSLPMQSYPPMKAETNIVPDQSAQQTADLALPVQSAIICTPAQHVQKNARAIHPTSTITTEEPVEETAVLALPVQGVGLPRPAQHLQNNVKVKHRTTKPHQHAEETVIQDPPAYQPDVPARSTHSASHSRKQQRLLERAKCRTSPTEKEAPSAIHGSGRSIRDQELMVSADSQGKGDSSATSSTNRSSTKTQSAMQTAVFLS